MWSALSMSESAEGKSSAFLPCEPSLPSFKHGRHEDAAGASSKILRRSRETRGNLCANGETAASRPLPLGHPRPHPTAGKASRPSLCEFAKETAPRPGMCLHPRRPLPPRPIRTPSPVFQAPPARTNQPANPHLTRSPDRANEPRNHAFDEAREPLKGRPRRL